MCIVHSRIDSRIVHSTSAGGSGGVGGAELRMVVWVMEWLGMSDVLVMEA